MHTYRCLLTVPGIGPRTASELVIGVDIAEFDGCFSFLSRNGSYTNIGDIIASPAYSLLRALGKEARLIYKLLEAPLYHCISLAETERRIVLRALEEIGEEAVISDGLLQVEDNWAHLQEARSAAHCRAPSPCTLGLSREKQTSYQRRSAPTRRFFLTTLGRHIQATRCCRKAT